MSSHDEDFTLERPVNECMAACERAASGPGWRIIERQATSIRCIEATQTRPGFTNPASTSVEFFATSGATRVVLKATNFGFGPFQSTHVRQQAQSLHRRIEAETERPPPPEPAPVVATRSVFINGARLSDEQLRSIEDTYRIKVADG